MFFWDYSSQATNNPSLLPPTFFYLCLTHQIHLSPPGNLISVLLLTSSFSQYQPRKNSGLSFYSYPENHLSKWFPHSKWLPSFPCQTIVNLFTLWQPQVNFYYYFMESCGWADPTKYKLLSLNNITLILLYILPLTALHPLKLLPGKNLWCLFLIVPMHIQMNHSIVMFVEGPMIINHRSTIILENKISFKMLFKSSWLN